MLDTSLIETQTPPLGNSERIRMKFGSFGIEVLENGPGIRVSSLYSTHDGSRVNRTFAVVAYPKVIEAAFKKEHEAIVNGQSIGIEFKNSGWQIDKQHQYFGEIETPHDYFSAESQTGETGKLQSAIHVYSLIINKGDAAFEYASIAEVHHPKFLQLDDLAVIYGPEFSTHQKKNGQITDFLHIIKSRILAL